MRDGWRATNLGEVLDPIAVRAGPTGPSLVLSVTEKRGIVPQDQVFKKRIATKDLSNYKVLEPGDIAFNPYLVWAGALGQWLGTEPGVTSPVYECFRVKPSEDPRFIGLLLESGLLAGYWDATAVGSIQRRRRTTVPVFEAAPVDLPPLMVQRRVVDLVDAVDTHAERASRVATSLSQLFFSATASIESLSGEFVELGEIAEVVSGITKDSKRQQDSSYVEVPYLRVANVQRAALDLAEVATIRVPPAKVRALRLEPRDVLFNEGGDRDKLGRGWVWEGQIDDCIHQNHVLRARIRDDRFDPYFVAGWANGPFGQRWFELNGTQTTNLASLNLSTLRRFPIPVADAKIQVAVGEALLQLKAVVGASAAAEAAVQRLRGRLLESLLSGEGEIPEPGSTDGVSG